MKVIRIMLVGIALMVCSIWVILFSAHCVRIDVADGISLWLMIIGVGILLIAFIIGLVRDNKNT